MLHNSILILILVSLIAANLPWLSERRYFVLPMPEGQEKSLLLRLVEWLLLLVLFILASLGLEHKLMGEIYRQDWEFYTVMVCLFLVFALPGFIYRYDLRPHLQRRQRRNK